MVIAPWAHAVLGYALAQGLEPTATTHADAGTSNGVPVEVVLLAGAAEARHDLPRVLMANVVTRLREEGLDASEAEATCADEACVSDLLQRGHGGFVVVLGVTKDERDYQTALRILERGTHANLGEITRDCTICGAQEVEDVVDEQAARLAARLVQLAQATAVSITSEPTGARVELDGRAVGTTPLRLRLAAGPHDVVLRAPTRATLRRRITVTPGFAESLTLRLPASTPPPSSSESGAPPLDRRARRRETTMRVAAGVSLALGAIALGALIPMFVLDGQPVLSRCDGLDRDFLGNCKFVHSTRSAAIGLSVVSSAGLVGGASLLGVAIARGRARRGRAR